jgi:hypothetical protein
MALLMVIAHVYRKLFEVDLIHVAPAPILTGLKRFNDRVTGLVIMLGGVLVLRVITAPYVPAGLAQA